MGGWVHMSAGVRLARRSMLVLAAVAAALGSVFAGLAEASLPHADATEPRGTATANITPLGSVHGSLTNDWVHLERWPANTAVTLTFDGGGAITRTVDASGQADIQRLGGHGRDLVPGTSIVATAAGGSPTRSLTLVAVTFGSLDPATNVATGTAPSNARVYVNLHDWTGQHRGFLQTTASAAGNWTADFTGIVDVVPGFFGNANVNDADGDSTIAEIRIPIPGISASISHDWIALTRWPASSTLLVSINGIERCTPTTDANGFVSVSSCGGTDLVAGQTVSVTDRTGGFARTLVLVALTFDVLDPDTDRASGTAAPGTAVRVQIFSGPNVLGTRHLTTDGAGSWSFDLTGIVDVVYGHFGAAVVFDADGDATNAGRPAADTTAPQVFTPSLVTADATSPAGASVTFSARATDNAGTPSFGCTPPSGSSFPIGDTTVTCTATDAAGNSTSKSFTVRVNGPAEQLNGLAADIQSSAIPPDRQGSLIVSLAAAEASFGAGNTNAGCNQLRAFENKVAAQSGKSIPADLAAELIASSDQAAGAAGCP